MNWKNIEKLLAAFSLACACFIREWVNLYAFENESLKYESFTVLSSGCAGIVLSVLLLTGLFAGLLYATERAKSHTLRFLAQLPLVVAVILCLKALKEFIGPVVEGGWFARTLFFSVSAFGGVVLFIFVKWKKTISFERWHARIFYSVQVFFVILSPFMIFNYGKAVWALRSERPKFPILSKDISGVPTPPRRIVWIMFDGMDYRLAFPDWQSTRRLKELDRFCRQAICAQYAYPPARNTTLSLPSYLVGKTVLEAKPFQGELLLRYANQGSWHSWRTEPNIFEKARYLGYRTALVGWFHPYCSLLGKNIDHCMDISRIKYTYTSSLWENVLDIMARNLRFNATDTFGVDLHAFSYQMLLRGALHVSTHPEIGFAFLHMNVPHWPGIYEKLMNRKLNVRPSLYRQHLGNLVVADETIAKLRHAMERKGLWDQTTILITSDHDRISDFEDPVTDKRVPFLLKLPNQRSGLSIHFPLNTVRAADLLLNILSGTFRTPNEVRQWLEHQTGTRVSTLN